MTCVHCAELAQAARPAGVGARSLQQLVQPMGAGKTFGTLNGGGGKFGPMAGGKPATQPAADGGDAQQAAGDTGVTASRNAPALVSRCASSSHLGLQNIRTRL